MIFLIVDRVINILMIVVKLVLILFFGVFLFFDFFVWLLELLEYDLVVYENLR